MSKENSRYRWFVVVVFFFFMLLHQTDKLMIGSLQVQISKDFDLNNQQWGLINSGALIVATILYPIWGYLYDRFSRTKLLSLASFIWGATTWLMHRTFGGFGHAHSPAWILLPRLVYFDRRLFRSWTVWENLRHSAACPTPRLFNGNDPCINRRAHDRRLAFGVLYHRPGTVIAV
jgi:MFS family permease